MPPAFSPFPPRILCVDGCATFRCELESALGNYGIELITATHGVDALMQFRAHNAEFSAVIIDHELSGMDGVAFLNQLAESGYRGQVLLTGTDFKLADLRAYAGFPIRGIFRKPLDAQMLAAFMIGSE